MRQKFITKKVENRMSKYPIYSQDGLGVDAVCTAKFFMPAGAWTWYVLEYDTKGKDTCFGVVINGQGEGEYGYFSLKELQRVRGFLGLHVERDMYFDPTPLKDIENDYLQEFLSSMHDTFKVLPL